MTTVFQKFDRERNAFINPSDFIKPIEGFPKICISTFSDEIVSSVAESGKAEEIASLRTANGRIPVYRLECGGVRAAFYQSPVGAPACVAEFEEVAAMGAEKYVLFGCCGILDQEAAGHKILVPTAAVRDEGTSYHYLEASEEIQADSRGTEALVRCLERFSVPYVMGKIWTTDGIYRETRGKIEDRKRAGCIGVDMECSAMMAAARFRGIPFAQFLFGADNLDCECWEQRDLTDYGFRGMSGYMKLAFACAAEM